MRVYSLARPLVQMGCRVTLLVSRRFPGIKKIEEEDSGVQIIQMADWMPERIRHAGLSPIDAIGRLEHVRRVRYDIVHGFDHRPAVSIPALFARRRWRIPYVADWADLWGFDGIGGERLKFLALADDHMENKTLLRADGITVINSYLQKRAEDSGIRSDKIRKLPIGSNVNTIHPLPKEIMRKKHGLPIDSHILVHIGFASYDADLLAESFAEYAKRNPKSLLLLVGGKMKELEKIVIEKGIKDMVINKGFVPYEQIEEYLSCGDVMLLPYTNRTINLGRYPNKMGDYMAAGRPTVTNPTGDLGEMVKKEGIGILAEESPSAFADAIDMLIKEESMREEIGRRARHVAETKFSWTQRARELEAFYKNLLNK